MSHTGKISRHHKGHKATHKKDPAAHSDHHSANAAFGMHKGFAADADGDYDEPAPKGGHKSMAQNVCHYD